jgi:hypothetical protein
MKITTIALAVVLIAPGSALAQGPSTSPGTGARLQLDFLDRLEAQAIESVDITIDPAMLKMAAGLLSSDRRNDAALALLNDVEGIYVRSFEFDRDNAYTQDDVNAVRKQLAAPGWSKMVEVESKSGRSEDRNGVKTSAGSFELVQVYGWREGNQSKGLAILVAEPRELTIVNIVGPIDLARFGALQGQFGIPFLPSVIDPRR